MNAQIVLLVTFILFLNACTTTKNKEVKVDDAITEQILFTSKRDGNFEVYLMNSDSTNVRRLTDHPKTDYGQCWSPDGKYILFYSDRSGNEEIWRMNSDGTHLINLTNAPSSERNAAYSPDGTTIVYTSESDNSTKDLYLMDSDGSNSRRLTYNNVYCESPTWTKDGKQIIFTLEVENVGSNKSFNGELFSIDANGTNQKRLTNKEGFDSGAAISPNGEKIAFYGKSEKGFVDIYVMNLDGTEIVNYTNDAMEDYSPSWSPDGHWISFTSGNASNYDIWKINCQTKQKIRLTTQPKRDETPYYNPFMK